MAFLENTLFVVGAGAGKDHSMPVGDDLAKHIRDGANLTFRSYDHRASGDPDLLAAIDRCFRDSAERTLIINQCRRIAAGIQTADSIDTFLDRFAGDDFLATAGKLMIAHFILRAERDSKLKIDWDSGDGGLDLRSLEQDWLHTFSRMMFSNVRKSDLDALKRTNIICFNYDRCLERYLIDAIKQGYQVEDRVAHQVVAGMNIVHPYGSLGNLPVDPRGSGPETLPYGARASHTDLLAVSDRLKTFTEVIDQNIDDKLKTMVSSAERVVFMGFAFHSPNVKLLTVESGSSLTRAFSSGVKISSQEKEALTSICHSMLGHGAHARRRGLVDIEIDHDCKRLLEVHRLNLLAN